MKTSKPRAISFSPTHECGRQPLDRLRARLRVQPRLDPVEDRTLLSTFTVLNTADAGPGSLRQAIVDSNAATGGRNTIEFAIPGSGIQTIDLDSPLPPITHSVLIDGRSQPGYAGSPLVDLNGSQAGTANGLTITGSDVTVRGLDIADFSSGSGILISGASATDNTIYGNFLGTDPTGTQAEPNLYGIQIVGAASFNLLGGTTSDAGNVISGNTNDGVVINGSGTSGNVVEGNYIGTDVTGTMALGNGKPTGGDGAGVLIDYGTSDNTIGGTTAGARNLISGNTYYGVWEYGGGTSGNVVEGNYIGTDVTGTTAFDDNGNPLANGNEGISLNGGASGNTIGGTTAGARNIISGNKNDGVAIDGSGSSGNVVEGNYIGTDVTGTTAFDDNRNSLGNGYEGVSISAGATDNTIGGTTAGAGNLISGNGNYGVEISNSGTSGNVVEGNFIGTDATGTRVTDSDGNSLGSKYYGVDIDYGATDNTIGGTTAAARNIISGNANDGVAIAGSGTSGNVVEGNYIGTDVTGTTALGNGKTTGSDGAGVLIDYGASDNTIGGVTAGARNLISGNTNYGVWEYGSGTSGNVVEGNSIQGNGYAGVLINGNATDNTFAGNLISGNTTYSVVLLGGSASGNVIEQSLAGANTAGTAANPAAASSATAGGSPGPASRGFGSNGSTGVGFGNSGDPQMALTSGAGGWLSVSQGLASSAALVGVSGGPAASQGLFSPSAPNSTMNQSGVSEGILSFYLSTAGREAALEMALDMSSDEAIVLPGFPAQLGSSPVPDATILQVARLGDVTGSALDLIATHVTLTVAPGNLESELESAASGTALLASFAPGESTGLGQGLGSNSADIGGGGDALAQVAQNPSDTAEGAASTRVDRLAPWERFAAGLDNDWQELRARLIDPDRANLARGADQNGTASGSPSPPSQVPPSFAPQADPSRSGTNSRPGRRGDRGSHLPSTSLAPGGATSSAVGRSGPGAGASVSSQPGRPSNLAAVDAVIEELGESAARSNRLVRIAPTMIDEPTDCAPEPLLSIIVASMSLSMIREQLVVAVRARHEPRQGWRPIKASTFR